MISLDWCRPKDPPISLGAASILATLKQKQLDFLHFQYNVNDPKFKVKDIISEVEQYISRDDTLLGIGAYIWNEHHIQEILKCLRSNSKAKLLIGGPQVSYCGRRLDDLYPGAHIFIRGSGAARIWLKRGGKPLSIIINETHQKL